MRMAVRIVLPDDDLNYLNAQLFHWGVGLRSGLWIEMVPCFCSVGAIAQLRFVILIMRLFPFVGSYIYSPTMGCFMFTGALLFTLTY